MTRAAVRVFDIRMVARHRDGFVGPGGESCTGTVGADRFVPRGAGASAVQDAHVPARRRVVLRWVPEFVVGDAQVHLGAVSGLATAVGLPSVDAIGMVAGLAFPPPDAGSRNRTVPGPGPQEGVDPADPYGPFLSRALSHDSGALRPGSQPGTRPGGGSRDPRPAPRPHQRRRSGRRPPCRRRRRRPSGDPRQLLRRHCCTVTVGRVFFEIVQRTGGCRGYGAANSRPVGRTTPIAV